MTDPIKKIKEKVDDLKMSKKNKKSLNNRNNPIKYFEGDTV